jgi:hypothetical protein
MKLNVSARKILKQEGNETNKKELQIEQVKLLCNFALPAAHPYLSFSKNKQTMIIIWEIYIV